MWVFHSSCQSGEADEALCSLLLTSNPVLKNLLFCFLFMAACLFILALNLLSEKGQRRRGLFLRSLLSGLTFTLILFISALGLQDHFLYFISTHNVTFKPTVFVLFPSCLILSLAVELNLQPATPGVIADAHFRCLLLKRPLASSLDAFATHCDILGMWGGQDGVWCPADAKW